MANTKTPPCFVSLPAESIGVVARETCRDIDAGLRVCNALGIYPAQAKHKKLSVRFLLHLGAAVRLLHMESQGFHYHRDAGLPSAKLAMVRAFLWFDDPAATPNEFTVAVMGLFLARFAWHARRDLGADVALDDLTDEAALDAIAELLWATRHARQVAGGPQP